MVVFGLIWFCGGDWFLCYVYRFCVWMLVAGLGDSVVGTCGGFCCYGLCLFVFRFWIWGLWVCAVACALGWWLIVWLLVCGWLFDVLYVLSRFFCGLLCGFRLFCVGW